jgi:L,D-transpeptidase catalytic domain
MSSTGRHAMSLSARLTPGERAERAWRRLRSPTRLGVTAAMAALLVVTGIIVAVVSAYSAATSPAARPAAVARANAAPALTSRRPAAAPGAAAQPRDAAMPLVLTAADHRNCPAGAAACVDLTRHVSWLQAHGKITFGPVMMEPGKPGGGHETPRGTFQVEWKAGPSLVSNIYHEPMPWATFFAPGGIAFHGGSLTAWSHGCVHLALANAHYYNEHLPIGAEVVVF